MTISSGIGIDVIGKSTNLHEAREIARKNEGNEYITKEKDGTFSVKKLDDSEVNKVENKPDAKFGPSVVDFSIKKDGKEKIVTNSNSSYANQIRSKATDVEEVALGIVEYAGKEINNAGKQIGNIVEYIEKKGEEAIKTVKGLVNKGIEFLSPLSGDVKNSFFQKDASQRSWKSNCGPACGANIAEMFLPGISKNNPNFILKVRDVDGPQSGALTEQQVINGVKINTKGKVTGKLIDNDYKHNEKDRLIKDIKSELKKGNLLMLCTGFGVYDPKKPDHIPSRHYVTIVGIDAKGNLLVSDPYKDKPGTPLDIWPVSKLQERMNRAVKSRNPLSSLTSFSKS